jgi:hypothetical protein
MRTAIIIGIGFALLGVFAGAAAIAGGGQKLKVAMLAFVGVWFLAAGVNLYIGVAHAGYSFMEELPIFLVIFGLPAVAALLVRWKF